MRDSFTSALQRVLLASPVLETLSSLQRSLDPLDIEGLAALWRRAEEPSTGTRPLGDSDAQEPTLQEWTHFVDTYLAQDPPSEGINGTGRAGRGSAPAVIDLRHYCLAYLLSATFKDCSMIVRLQPSSTDVIALIDLDVKSIARLSRWERLDREIVTAYAGVESPRTCVDERARDVEESS